MLTQMICSELPVLKGAAIALLCGVLLSSPVRSQAEPGPSAEPQKVPDKFLLPKEQPDGAADRKALLADLYQRLSRAEDVESSRVVASAIEKLWLRSGSDTVDLLMSRVGKLMEDEEFDVALKLLDSIIEIAPDYSEGWTRRAAVFFVRKDFGKSLEDLRQALALDPSHYKAIQGLGLLMQELGDKEAALKAFRRVLKVHPHLEEARQAERELSRDVEGQGI